MSTPVAMPQYPFTPLLGWELGSAPTDQGGAAIIVTLHTAVGPIRFFVVPSDAKGLAAALEEAASRLQAPQILRPMPGLMGPDGRPLQLPNGVSQAVPETSDDNDSSED